MPNWAVDAPRSTRPPSQTSWRGRAMHSRAQGGKHARGGGIQPSFARQNWIAPWQGPQMAHWVPPVATQGDALGLPVSHGTWGVDIDPAPAQRGPAWVPLAPNHVPRRIQLFNWIIEYFDRRVFLALRSTVRSVLAMGHCTWCEIAQ